MNHIGFTWKRLPIVPHPDNHASCLLLQRTAHLIDNSHISDAIRQPHCFLKGCSYWLFHWILRVVPVSAVWGKMSAIYIFKRGPHITLLKLRPECIGKRDFAIPFCLLVMVFMFAKFFPKLATLWSLQSSVCVRMFHYIFRCRLYEPSVVAMCG